MRQLHAWGFGALAARKTGHLAALSRHLLLRARWHSIRRFGDLPLSQLRSVERAFSRGPAPDVLIFSDFVMDWVPADDGDYRHLPDMIRDALGRPFADESVVGHMYNARIVIALLTGLASAQHRPRVIVVPLSTVTAQSLWLAHPALGYAAEAADLRRLIGTASSRARVSSRPATNWPRGTTSRWMESAVRSPPLNSSRRSTPYADATRAMAAQRDDSLSRRATSSRQSRRATCRRTCRRASGTADAGGGRHPARPLRVCRSGARHGRGRNGEAECRLVATDLLGSAAANAEVVDLASASAPAHFVDAIHLNAAGRYALAAAVARAARGPLRSVNP